MLFSRPRTVTCHFCSSRLSLAPAKGKDRLQGDSDLAFGSTDDFVCSVCDCRNERDANGELVSSTPAQRDPALNKDAFSKRASPGPSLTAPTFARSPFCHSCLSNQSLQVHLLASFPDSDDSDSEPSAQSLPDYKNSLDSRYPLVCANCQGAVDEVLGKADYRARAFALGSRLRESSTQGRPQKGERHRAEEQWKWWLLGVAWSLRGGMFWLTQAAGIGVCALGAAAPSLFVSVGIRGPLAVFLETWAPTFCALSLLWAFWDPTWDQTRKARARGRQVSVAGRSQFIAIQAVAFVLRLSLAVIFAWRVVESQVTASKILTASLVILASAYVASFSTIRVKEPLNIRLAASLRPSREPLVARDPLQATLEPLAFLSISPFRRTPPSSSPKRAPASSRLGSGTTAATARTPAFGAPSFPSSDDGEDHSMDWEPLPGKPDRGAYTFAPQSLFAPVQPSGLDDLFARGLRVDDGGGEAMEGVKEVDGDVETKGGGWFGWGRKG